MKTRAITLALLAGCYAGIPGGGGPDDDPDAADTDGGETESGTGDDTDADPPPPAADAVPAVGLRRLTAAQYTASLRDLVGDAPLEAATIKLQLLPTDASLHGYSTMSRGVSAAHVDAHVEIAAAVAEAVAQSPTDRGALAPCLEQPPFDDVCLEEMLTTVGRRAYRRPLSTDEIEDLFTLVEETELGTLEAMLMALLLAPEFIYRIELGTDEGGEVRRLDPFELASRLSFTLWGRGPDDALLDAAEADDLDLAAEADRLLSDPHAREWAGVFFDEHLQLTAIPPPADDPEFLDNITVDSLPEAMRTEALAFVDDTVFEQQGSYADLLTSTAAFVEHDGLAAIYGVAPEGAVTLSDRGGLLTRAAVLVGPSVQTMPVLRGAAVAERFLCLELEVPSPEDLPPDSPAEPPPFDPTQSSREAWEAQTSGAACAGCHDLINAPGFALDGFDALGRRRTVETIYDPEGLAVGEAELDTAVDVFIDGAWVSIDGAADLARTIADSETGRDCFARRWLRFADGRHEADEDDPVLAAFADAPTVLDGLREVVLADSFGFVRTPDEEEED